MARKLVLILAFYVFGFSLGQPKCSSDPCKDLWTAKKCDKVKYCISEDWSKLKPTGNRDDVCDICLKMVKEARDTLQSNETREQLLEVFEGSCRLLFLKPAVELCDKVVDQLVPELVEILSSQMDPETVCTVAKLCNNEAFRSALKNSKDCVYCETLIDTASKEINALSEKQFKNEVLDLCRTAGGFSDACFLIGSKYSGVLYNNAKRILNQKPCETTLLCPTGFSDSQPSHKVNKRTCSMCTNTLMSLRKQLLNVKTPEEFVENTLEICENMGFFNSSCSKVANLAFYEKLKKSDKLPHLLCQVTFCRVGSTEEVPVWPLIPAHSEAFGSVEDFDAVEFLETLEMFFPAKKEEKIINQAKPTISYGDPIGNPIFFSPRVEIAELGNCKTCSDVFKILSESEKVDDEYLKGSVNAVCGKVQNSEICKRFIENFSPVLTAAFAEGAASKKMCEDLVPFCKIKENELSLEPTSNDRNCDFCLNAVKILKQNDSVMWSSSLEEKCNALPEDSKTICMTLVGNSLALVKNSRENEICSFIKLCEPSSAVKRNKLDSREIIHSENSLCHTCIVTFQTVVDLLNNNSSEVIIRLVLESLCLMLPPEEHKICSTMVQIIGIDKLKKFIENLKPTEACSAIHFCERVNEPEVAKLPVVIAKFDSGDKIPCKFCLMAIKLLINQLEDDKTEESIRKALDGLCQYFPEETRNTCRNLIDQYTEDIIDMLLADFNATEICTFLKICPEHHLLGHANEKNFTVFDVQTNQIRDSNEDGGESALDSYNEEGKASVDKAFQKFHEIVQECAMCEALVGVISSHKRMLSKDFSFPAEADFICSIVPADKRRKCTSMVVSYGPSFVNLIVDLKVDLNDVCVRVDLCDAKLQAKVNQPVSASVDKFIPKANNDCLLGPSFWCANPENAEKCGTFLHCQETVWKNW